MARRTFDEVVGKYRTAAKKLRVGEVEFSGFTYQVQVFEGEEEFWPFLQLDEEGVQDALCQCEDEPTCVHLAAAVLKILESGEPLHVRFQKHLWNVLGQIFADRFGYEVKVLEREGDAWVLRARSGREVFRLEGAVDGLIEGRAAQTEETSIKFSGLEQEELQLWKEGRPSPALRYELSFWSDLAKRMMDARVTFGYGEDGLPNEVRGELGGLSVMFYVSRANLPKLVRALKTVESELVVHDLDDKGLKLTYDRESGALHVEGAKRAPEVEGGVGVDGWLFVPGDGFYARGEEARVLEPVVPAEDVGALLSEQGKVVARHLEGEEVHTRAVRPQFEIDFDEEWNLHVRCFLFEKGDLQKPGARHFGRWAYLVDKGFYPLERSLFEEASTVVPPSEVSGFVHRHRAWLNTQEGFHTHLATVESSLGYGVDEEGNLRFEGRVELAGKSRDFGEWIYVGGQGFYSKARGRAASSVRAGLVVERDEVAGFIRSNREDLELIDGFLSDECPVEGGSLRITLGAKQRVLVKPKYELHSRWRSRDVLFFDEFVYLRDQGFSEIPFERRLPEKFAQPVTLKGQELHAFLTYELPALKPFVSYLDPRLEQAEKVTLTIEEAQQQAGMIELKLCYQTEVGSVAVLDLWEALHKRHKLLFTDAGLLDLKELRFQWLRGIDEDRLRDGRVVLGSLEFIRLIVAEDPTAKGERAQSLLDIFSNLSPSESPDLRGLKSQLRPYQEEGVDWLWFLYSNHLSGLLCDDMGLGKTHQAMALMAAAANTSDQRPYLIVCPTSVIYHWREKLAQFLPSLNVLTFYGPQRSLKSLHRADVLLTSYGVLRSERERFSLIPFQLAIFDEVQVAKNYASITHAALSNVRARMRLGLTGTPIENNLRELKSLFDLILPTYLPPERQFRDRFILPIEKDGDQGKKAVLRRVIRPFLMRRKKEEVLKDLPEKTEELAHCELSDEQRALYNETILRQRDQLVRALKDEKEPAPYLHVFAMLTHLKQICDHPAVHHKTPEKFRQHQSGKWDLFCELLSQARESEQKVVVFSQYLFMLDIIEAYLKEQGIEYAAIRGSTAARDVQLEKFQKDPKCQVFVGSLQAVGLGVDLTAASVVIHYDRWWNAARERQATDRVHRIGQTRGVQVFKLLTLGTIEERIDQLITQKGALMEEVVGSDEQGIIKAFSRAELIALLSEAL
jgi:superfamily II DNA or RNA helicase